VLATLQDRPRPSQADAGFLQHLLESLSAALTYLKARLELAGLESKEAGVHYAIILALAVVALIVVIFGYFFFCLALVFLIAWLIGEEHAWIWVTFGMALLHFGGAAACLWMAKTRLGLPMFAATLQEFRKDHEWLNSKTAKAR
jgi:uncharacterized membrane protein YqjE